MRRSTFPIIPLYRSLPILVALVTFLSIPASARPVPIFDLGGNHLSATATSTGSHKVIQVNVSNSDDKEHEVTFPYGTVFDSQDTSYQSLALTKTHESLIVPSGTIRTIRIKTACMHASRGVAPAGYSDWTFKENRGLKNLLTAYYAGSLIQAVQLLIKPDMLDTEEKRDNFLQAIVWVYFDATEEQIIAFSSKYLFSSRKEAKEFIHPVYPTLKMALDRYKEIHGER